MTQMDSRFSLRRITPTEWVIVDVARSEHDPNRTVACICEVGAGGYDVVWLRDLDLSPTFASPDDVLDAVIAVEMRRSRSRRPVAIPHLPPADDRIPA